MSKEEKELAISDLYPNLTPEEQAEAEFNLAGYLEVVRRIFERVSEENPQHLTRLEKSANLKQKRQAV